MLLWFWSIPGSDFIFILVYRRCTYHVLSQVGWCSFHSGHMSSLWLMVWQLLLCVSSIIRILNCLPTMSGGEEEEALLPVI